MALLTIGATAITPEPSSYDFKISDITEASRNASGTLIAELITTKVSIDITWSYLTNAQYVAILALFSTFFFSVTYHDARTGTTATKTMYVGDRSTGIFRYNSIGNSITGWKDVKFSLIEK